MPVEIILFVAGCALLAFLYLDMRTASPQDSLGAPGRSHDWWLDANRKTEIVSNKRLGKLQRHQDDGGLLRTNDQMVVWAREFLDDDILYRDVLANIRRGITYFYILDRLHTERFRNLLSKLYEDLRERTIVDQSVNVIFVRPELTLNNFVILAYGTDRQVAYSALIFDERPFAWIRQDTMRSRVIMDRVRVLVAGVALEQADPGRFRGQDVFEYFNVDDQIMDFRALGSRLLSANDLNPERAYFELRDVVAEVPLGPDPEAKVANLASRLRVIK